VKPKNKWHLNINELQIEGYCMFTNDLACEQSRGVLIYRRMIAIGAYVHFLAFLTFLYGSNRFFTLYNMETK